MDWDKNELKKTHDGSQGGNHTSAGRADKRSSAPYVQQHRLYNPRDAILIHLLWILQLIRRCKVPGEADLSVAKSMELKKWNRMGCCKISEIIGEVLTAIAHSSR